MPLPPSSTVVALAAWLACGIALARDPAGDAAVARPLVHLVPGSPPGGYALSDWKRDWPGCDFEDGVGEGRVSVVGSGAAAWWQVTYAAGGVGPDRSGAGWRWRFTRQPLRACELTYALRFDDGFEFVKGGKLPGLCGGPETITGGDACDGRQGWSVRLMWRRDGRGQAYVYHAGKRGTYGDEFDFPKDARFPVGDPVTIRMSVAMNDPSRADGTLRVWVGAPGGRGRLVVDRADLRYTAVDTIGIDSILFNTFHGGNGDDWAPRTTCTACFTDFRITAAPVTVTPR